MNKPIFHLPGLFEFYDFYKVFFRLFYEKNEWFYDSVIGSVYGAPADCIWGGGRVGCGEDDVKNVISLLNEYGISAELTFSNSLLRAEHLDDRKCNYLCGTFTEKAKAQSGVVIHSDLLLDHIKNRYPSFYFVSSTTKVLTFPDDFVKELNRSDFRYVVPDFRLNKRHELLSSLSDAEKIKVEFLCNECCDFGCASRRECYENVSRKNLGESCPDHVCASPEGKRGYRFSKAMENPAFIGRDDIDSTYLPQGFSHFKLEGRTLGSAVILEFLLHYLTRPEYRLKVREEIYLDGTLDLF